MLTCLNTFSLALTSVVFSISSERGAWALVSLVSEEIFFVTALIRSLLEDPAALSIGSFSEKGIEVVAVDSELPSPWLFIP